MRPPGDWSFPFFNDEAAAFKTRELDVTDALLLGRKTYEGFSAAWPTMEGVGEFGVKMNTMPKYVVTSTLEPLTWEGSIPVTRSCWATAFGCSHRPVMR